MWPSAFCFSRRDVTHSCAILRPRASVALRMSTTSASQSLTGLAPHDSACIAACATLRRSSSLGGDHLRHVNDLPASHGNDDVKLAPGLDAKPWYARAAYLALKRQGPMRAPIQGGVGVIEPLPQHLTHEAVHEEQVVLPSIDIRKGERLPRRSTTDPGGGRLHTRSNIHTSTDHHGRGSLRRDRNEHDQQNQDQKSSRVKPKPTQLTRPDSTQN